MLFQTTINYAMVTVEYVALQRMDLTTDLFQVTGGSDLEEVSTLPLMHLRVLIISTEKVIR